MKEQTIGFLGTGNMGQSLIKGLALNNYPADQLFACDHHADKLKSLSDAFPTLRTTQDNATLIQNSDVLVLAIKPQGLAATLSELSPLLCQRKPLLISIAAGITSEQIQQWSNVPAHALQVIRAMPNTPALLQAGITGLYADNEVSAENKEIAEMLFKSVGEVVWVNQEDLMDVITALSGSGPAYFFYILEAFIQGATQLGLSTQAAQKLISYTMLGASKMVIADKDIALLRQNVTSKGGTTEAGLQALEQNHLPSTIAKALMAATERSKTLREKSI